MSNIALSWAFRCHVGNASAKAVLVYLADRASDDGTAAFPKIETIVNVTELSERTVRSSLKTLQERGFIRRRDTARRAFRPSPPENQTNDDGKSTGARPAMRELGRARTSHGTRRRSRFACDQRGVRAVRHGSGRRPRSERLQRGGREACIPGPTARNRNRHPRSRASSAPRPSPRERPPRNRPCPHGRHGCVPTCPPTPRARPRRTRPIRRRSHPPRRTGRPGRPNSSRRLATCTPLPSRPTARCRRCRTDDTPRPPASNRRRTPPIPRAPPRHTAWTEPTAHDPRHSPSCRA